MKQISTSLASKLKQDTIVERDYIIFKGETTRHYLWFNLYDDCYKDGNFIGTFVMKRIEITYNDSDLEFKNKEFNAYKEYKLDNGTWESINYGTFIVQAVEESDTKEEIKVTAYDYGLKFANTYKTDLDYASGTVTLFQVLQEVCQKVGVSLENTSIDNGNFIVDSNQFGENTLYGNVVTAIAQISCNFAKITPENKLKLLFKNESNIIIETKDYEEFEDKRDTRPYNAVSLGLSDIEGENVTLVAQGVDPDEAKYLTINDNPFAYTQDKRTQLIQAIFDKINGFGYSSFVLKNCLYPQLECGDLVQIRNKEGKLIDSIVLRPTFEGTVLNFEAPSTITSTVSYVQPLDAIEISKRTEITVDKQNQTIKAVVESNQEVVSKTAQLSIEVDELKGQISEVADVTITADGYGIINAEKINVSEPIMLRIRPNGEDFALLYPRKNLYPSSNLYPKNRKITFENLTTNEKIEYIIPKDLWYLDNNNYDEFILDYENLQCYINRKIGVNADGTKYMLELPTIEEFDYPTINLTEGDYKIYTNSFSNAYIYVRLMTQNIYTSQFATKVELSSSITQTKEQINLEVSKKIDENEVIASINLTSEEAKINASKITLEGIVTANENFKVLLDGSIEAKNGTFSGDITSNNAVITGGSLTVGSKFKVTNDGTLTATGGTFIGNITSNNAIITGGSLTVGNKFKVTSDGTLTANNGTFSGTITADSGTIGGASIDSQGVFFNSGNNGWGLWGTTNHANIVLHAGANSSNIGGAPFRVLNDGTVYATKANITGAISATTISCTNGTFAGWSVSGSGLSGNRLGLNTSTGQITVFPVSGGGYIISNGLRLSASAGAAISSNSNGSVAAPSSGLDLKGCSGATVYIGCMVNAAGTTEASCLSVENGAVNMRGGTFYVNGTPVGSSSSRNMKKNIRLLKDEEKVDIYDAIKGMNLYHYDFKSQYVGGLKDNFGFIIEDIESTILKRTLHVKQDEKDENVKYYSDGDLIRTLLIVVQQLQEKVEKLGG